MEDPELSLIVPTYNEAENMPALVQKIDQALRSHCRYELIVVDDGSPDGTARVARDLSLSYPVRVLVRNSERGLASAVVHGFAHASGKILGVMDADLQHPPELVPQLLEYARHGADVVIASRYQPGGSTREWARGRLLISKVATALVHLILPSSRKASDPLSGFFLVRREALEGVKLNPIGYKILLEILVRGQVNQVVSVPYTFERRRLGRSKYGFQEQVNYLRHILRLLPADGSLRQFLKFCLVGASGVVVNMGLLWLLTEIAGLFYLISAVVAIESSIINNFIWNDLWTFRERRMAGWKARLERLAKFNLVSAAGIGINLGILWLLTEALSWHYLLSNLCGIAAATVWNFLANLSWTWRKRAQ